MATKPSNGPQFPFITIPMADEIELDFAKAIPHQDLAAAQTYAQQQVKDTGVKVIIFQAMTMYGKITKVDVTWKWGG